MNSSTRLFARLVLSFFAWLVVAALARAQSEPAHPILSIPGSPSGADGILTTYTEAQFLQFVPQQSPRGADYGFVPAVVSGDNDWSWSAAAPNQLTSLPSGTVFPNSNFPLQTNAVPVLSGKTINVPYYLAAGSTTRKSLVFAEIDYQKRRRLRTLLTTLSVAYVQSGTSPATRDDRYARRVALALDFWATCVPDYFMTEKNNAQFISAAGFTTLTKDIQRASDHNGLAHEWADDELFAFDAIYDSQALVDLSVEKGYDVRAHIKNNLFCNFGDFFSQRVPVSVAISTNLSGPFTILAETARVLNRPDYMLWMGDYIDATVTKKITRDGTLTEGIGYSVGYLNENRDAARATRDYFLTRPANTQELQDIQALAGVAVNAIQFGINNWNSLRLPNGQLPAFGDTNFNGATARNAGVSGLLPAYGHAALGAGTGAQSIQLNQNFSDDANHMRADVTAFTLWGLGTELLGNIRYYNGTPGRQFGEQILSHNAVTIDRSNMTRGSWTVGNNNHKFTSGNLTLFEPGNNGLAATEVDGQRAYTTRSSRYQRVLVANTVDLNRPYVVDLFRVTGGTTHDYTLHGSIRFDSTAESSLPLTPNPAQYPLLENGETWVEPTSSGSSFPYYGFWRNVSSGTTSGDFQITYRDTSSANRDLRLWALDSGGSTLHLGITPNPERTNTTPPNFYKYWRPSLIVRHRASTGPVDSLFAGVIEPLANGVSSIQSVQRLPLSVDNREAVALRVTFVDGRVDTLLVNLANPRVAGASGGSASIGTADGQFALTGRIGAFTQSPAGPRYWTVGASNFTFAGRQVAPTGSRYSGAISAVLRKADGAANDAFVTSSALPAGTALRGRQLSLTFGTYQVVNSSAVQTGISEMFEIDRVEAIDGQTHIVLKNDPQIVWNGTTTVEQMAPQRTFTGANQFEILTSSSAVPDLTPPVLTLPTDLVAEATGPAGAAVTFAASAVDNADGDVPVSLSHASGSTFPLGATTVTASAEDNMGNEATGTFSVAVRDTTPPALTLPANITTTATSASGAVVTFTVTASDSVSGNLTPVVSPASGSTFALGTTTVTVSATDTAGNSTQRSFTVTVNAAPDFSLAASPASQTVSAGTSTTYNVNVTGTNAFNGAVALSAQNLPASTTASFSPSSVSGTGPSTVTVTTSAGTPGGTHTLTFRGTNGSLVRTIAVSLVVNSSPVDRIFEAEAVVRTSTGATTAPQADANASGGTWIALQADGVGDFVDYTLPNIPAGTYNLRLKYKAHPNRGILSLKVDGTTVGSTLEQYSATVAYPERDFGRVTFSAAGNHVVRLTVTGKNAVSGAFTLSADTFTLVPVTTTSAKLPIAPSGVMASAHDGNVPANAVDGNLATRWSANGDGQWIRFDLGAAKTVTSLKIAWFSGDTRRSRFDVQTSSDGVTWTTLVPNLLSSGTSTARETFDIPDRTVRYVRYLGHGNTSNLWNSITEFELWGF